MRKADHYVKCSSSTLKQTGPSIISNDVCLKQTLVLVPEICKMSRDYHIITSFELDRVLGILKTEK